MARKSIETEAMLELADELLRFQKDALKSDLPDIGEEQITSSEMRERPGASRDDGADGIPDIRAG